MTRQLSAVFFASLAMVATASQYYVDCSAATSGNGSQASPWNSVSQANDFTFGPGDILSLKSNVSCTGTLSPQGSGNETHPIRLMSYPPDSILGPPTIDGNGETSAVVLTNQDYWRISNLSVTNPAGELARRQGIWVTANDGKIHRSIIIDHNIVHDVAGQTDKATHSSDFAMSAGISISASNGSRFDDVWVRDNLVKDCGGGAIKVRPGQANNLGMRSRVSHNTIDACGGDGVIIAYAESPSIDHNIASNLGKGRYPWTGGNFAGMWVMYDHDPVIAHNVVYGSSMSVYDSEAFDCDLGVTGTCLVEYNYSHDNAGGAFLNCDGCGESGGATQIVRYNVFENDCRMISVGEVPELWFYNNVMYCPSQDFDVNVPPSTHFINNIFVGRSNSTLPTGSGVDWKSNLFQNMFPPTENGMIGDPGFVSPGVAGKTLGAAFGYRVKTGSPALLSGATVESNGNLDFFGADVANYTAPNVGAYNGAGVSV
ncbi:Ig group 2 domain-containingprotein [Pleurostoma richardsiae]|uniref:Ig group 2 domain-containingprotein n=1 Tax=Pleurostoma richardsiae TaxID=41990 RepID=A0AA38VL60_9PEZI|nr:Ig group 2 domain-containingprotein [Pleurostoma richardsiae]